jgi:hypothetical protein
MLLMAVALLPVSCCFFRLDHHQGAARVTMSGPVIREIGVQHERAVWRGLSCASKWESRCRSAPLYRVQSGHDGRLVEHRRGAHPRPSASAAAGPAAAEQAEGRSLPEGRAAVLDSYRAARHASDAACRALWPRPYGHSRACVQNLLTGIADQLAAQRRILKADMRQRRTNRALSLARVCGHFEVPAIRQWVPVRARRRNVVAAAR